MSLSVDFRRLGDVSVPESETPSAFGPSLSCGASVEQHLVWTGRTGRTGSLIVSGEALVLDQGLRPSHLKHY